jgi:hypothetical protein
MVMAGMRALDLIDKDPLGLGIVVAKLKQPI